MKTKRKTSTSVSVADLKARLALLREYNVRYYSDGLLELHIDTNFQAMQKQTEPAGVSLGAV